MITRYNAVMQTNGVRATMCMVETPEGEWVQYKDIQHIIDAKILKCCGTCVNYDIVDNIGGVCLIEKHQFPEGFPVERTSFCDLWSCDPTIEYLSKEKSDNTPTIEQKELKTCKWKNSGNQLPGIFEGHSECGHECFISGWVEDNYKYCPYCGGVIVHET